MSQNKITQIRKRNGRIVDFNEDKIVHAIYKATEAVGRPDEYLAKKYSQEVADIISGKFHTRSIPAVEEIQDIVEEVLITNRQIKAAKAYILYRDQRARLREMKQHDQFERCHGRLSEPDRLAGQGKFQYEF